MGPGCRSSWRSRCSATVPLPWSSTSITIFLSGRLSRRINRNTTLLLVWIAGILLTAIAVTLLVGGGTRMVNAILTTLS
jgi:multiple antibiotic resistance protein